MKKILLSTTLALTLALSGCDDDNSTNNETLTTSSVDELVRQNVDLNVLEGTTDIATLSTTGVSFEITGGNDASFFLLSGTKLSFKTAQNYLEGGDNSYNVEISATDDAHERNGRLLLVSVNVTASQTVTTVAVEETVVDPTTEGVIFSTVEDNRVTWDAANSACNMMNPAGTWTLPTIEQYRANSADLLAMITVDSDGNSSTPSAFTSVLWSSTDADVVTSKMGWGYFETPAVDTAQLVTSPFFFTCVKK